MNLFTLILRVVAFQINICGAGADDNFEKKNPLEFFQFHDENSISKYKYKIDLI